MSRTRVRSATLVATGLALVLAAPAVAGYPTVSLPGTWSHAQINVVGPHGKPHTEIFDQGRVQSVTPSSVTLLESDGSVVTVQVAPNATVVVNGRPGSFSEIQPGFTARTLGIDGRPAIRVTGTSPKPPRLRPRRLVPPVTPPPTTTVTTATTAGG